MEDELSILKTRIKELEKEIEVSDALLKERDRLLEAIPKCNIHRDKCISHAIEWINRKKEHWNE